MQMDGLCIMDDIDGEVLLEKVMEASWVRVGHTSSSKKFNIHRRRHQEQRLRKVKGENSEDTECAREEKRREGV